MYQDNRMRGSVSIETVVSLAPSSLTRFKSNLFVWNPPGLLPATAKDPCLTYQLGPVSVVYLPSRLTTRGELPSLAVKVKLPFQYSNLLM